MPKNPSLRQRPPLLEKHGIKSFPERQHNSPFEPWFDQIEKLSRETYRNYGRKAKREMVEKPWRIGIRSQADILAAQADELSNDGSIREATWRFSLETRMFSRFEEEVTCNKGRCRGRLWRSEEEPVAIDLSKARDLDRRREVRKPCCCRSIFEKRGRKSLGQMFAFRAEHFVLHDKDLAKDFPNPEKPDRVLGLKCTSGFQRLLREVEDDPRLVDYSKFSPVKAKEPNSLPPLFPFLVLECKTEKNANNDINLQTSGMVRTLLHIQNDLRSRVGNRSRWESGPLVWYLTHKGPSWRVGAAYIVERGRKSEYHTVTLWDGNIASRDKALQLILILDFILDWARDIFRRNVISELKLVVDLQARAREVSLPSDFDRLSVRRDTWEVEQPSENEESSDCASDAEDTTHHVLQDNLHEDSSDDEGSEQYHDEDRPLQDEDRRYSSDSQQSELEVPNRRGNQYLGCQEDSEDGYQSDGLEQSGDSQHSEDEDQQSEDEDRQPEDEDQRSGDEGQESESEDQRSEDEGQQSEDGDQDGDEPSDEENDTASVASSANTILSLSETESAYYIRYYSRPGPLITRYLDFGQLARNYRIGSPRRAKRYSEVASIRQQGWNEGRRRRRESM